MRPYTSTDTRKKPLQRTAPSSATSSGIGSSDERVRSQTVEVTAVVTDLPLSLRSHSYDFTLSLCSHSYDFPSVRLTGRHTYTMASADDTYRSRFASTEDCDGSRCRTVGWIVVVMP